MRAKSTCEVQLLRPKTLKSEEARLLVLPVCVSSSASSPRRSRKSRSWLDALPAARSAEAPPSSSANTTSAWHSSAAQWRGVRPSSPFPSAEAPCLVSSRTTSAARSGGCAAAAHCSGVAPLESRPLMAAAHAAARGASAVQASSSSDRMAGTSARFAPLLRSSQRRGANSSAGAACSSATRAVALGLAGDCLRCRTRRTAAARRSSLAAARRLSSC
mmetsp:Transcript_16589/g.52527  ORF Transcript_16589/g.52527 Transcript_16589/m.52527 type:complete len:217 (-) Transcript_16589:372-1022(-)